jgi:hypothetical protein
MRQATDIMASCEPAAAKTAARTETRWPAQVRDISVGGNGLLLGRRFERGAVLIVELPDNVHGGTRHLPVRVVHATAASPGHWIVGCSFIRMLTEEDLEGIWQEPAEPE